MEEKEIVYQNFPNIKAETETVKIFLKDGNEIFFEKLKKSKNMVKNFRKIIVMKDFFSYKNRKRIIKFFEEKVFDFNDFVFIECREFVI